MVLISRRRAPACKKQQFTTFCIQNGRSNEYKGVGTNFCVQRAEKQTMPFKRADDSQEPLVPEDAGLFAAIAGGDQHALATLYRRHGGLIYSLLVRMLTNEMEAQEVMQDTF